MEHLTQKELDRKQQKAEWYQRNKVRINKEAESKPERRAYKKKYYQDNKEKTQQLYQENRDGILEKQREYTKTPESKASRKAYRDLPENKEKKSRWNAKYANDLVNKQKMKEYQRQYRLKKKFENNCN